MAKGLWTILNVNDIDRSATFYKALKLRTKIESMGPMRWASVDLAGSGLLFFPKDSPDADAETRAWLSGELGKGVVLTVGVAKAAKTWELARAAGAKVESPLEDNPWGGQGFMIVDPDGYVLNVTDRFPSAPKKKAATKSATPQARPAAARVKKASRKPAKKAAKKAVRRRAV